MLKTGFGRGHRRAVLPGRTRFVGLQRSSAGRGLLTPRGGRLPGAGPVGLALLGPDTRRRTGGPREHRSPRRWVGSASGGMDELLSRDTLTGLAANDNGNDPAATGGWRRGSATASRPSGDRFTSSPEKSLSACPIRGAITALAGVLCVAGGGFGGGSFELSVEAQRREAANDDIAPGATRSGSGSTPGSRRGPAPQWQGYSHGKCRPGRSWGAPRRRVPATVTGMQEKGVPFDGRRAMGGAGRSGRLPSSRSARRTCRRRVECGQTALRTGGAPVYASSPRCVQRDGRHRR